MVTFPLLGLSDSFEGCILGNWPPTTSDYRLGPGVEAGEEKLSYSLILSLWLLKME